MQGIKLSERFYKFVGKPMIEKKFPDYMNRIAVGLIGEGSECYGFDDVISQDHDWGPDFCIWMNEQDYKDIGDDLQSEYEKLPKEFAGIKYSKKTDEAYGRRGVIATTSFYKKFTGLDKIPENNNEWYSIPQENLSVCTNGKIFNDEFGEFTYYRKKLSEYYPEDVRLCKILSLCISISREGQYNYYRCLQRNDIVAAQSTETIFVNSVIKMVFLLNWKYAPFYKWSFVALQALPILGIKVSSYIRMLIAIPSNSRNSINQKVELIDNICAMLAKEMNNQQIIKRKSNYLLDYKNEILDSIQDENLKNYNL